MNQRLLHKTIESFADTPFATTEELLTHVLRQIVSNDRIEITGGRVWRLDVQRYAYEMVA